MVRGRKGERAAGAPDLAGIDVRKRLFGLGVVTLFAALLFGSVAQTSPWHLLEMRVFDYLSTLAPPQRPTDSPVIVAIDEPSMMEIGAQWPWPRSLHGELLTALRAAGARAIALDVIFAEPAADPAEDANLAAALGPDVVLAGDETLIRTPHADQFVRTEPLAVLTETGARTGIASVSLDADGVLRHVPAYPDSLARQLMAVARQTSETTAGEKLIQTFGPARTYETVSYYQALHPEQFLPEGTFRGRTVIIGLSLQNAPTLDAAAADAFPTSDTLRSGRLVSGAEVQATLFDNLSAGLFITPVGPLPGFLGILAASVLAAFVTRGDTGWATGATALMVIAGAVVGSSLLVRYGRIFVPPLAPLGSFLLVCGVKASLDFAAERRRRRQITSAFSQYLAPAVVAKLAANPSLLKLGGERRVLTILFCDVRGFTTISETLKDDPEQLTTLINRLLTPLSDIVLESGGTIDKYIGDCIMAFWNAPLDVPDHAVRAVQAALAMLEAVEALNARLLAEAMQAGRPSPPPLRIGIGINTGACIVGNMGSTRRFDYSVLGDSVNLASRLEGESKNYGVPLLIGEATAALVAKVIAVAELDRIKVKGRTGLSAVYAVLPEATPQALRTHAAFLRDKYDGTLDLYGSKTKDAIEGLPDLRYYYASHGTRRGAR
ncbi:adenylate cyclase [Rhizobium sp. Leaf371]|uniref:CHASE2 domain-containing protein n=1 Tax=Rhizobium sp. Leaf371 TaxID=1736355 RepID=UPI000712342A|nr:adenylate/guanylate cyclase domain-containing protein [Rhizobium sp. Leaf371]KQS71435.1 adenylate cyclase [Rhizobium sp. Leaf371]